VGYLYKRVDSFIRSREGQSNVGMIEQSLCHHLQTQLTEYYRLIAVLESQMALTTATPITSSGGDGMSLQAQESGLTLRRLDVWINEWRLRLRMMSVCVEGAKGTSQLSLTHIH
jgi:gamma-tubulin complex component 3